MTTLSVRSSIFDRLSLHLDDVEFLRNAFVVQALSGPLVRFSNRGRYEPYLAKSWSQKGNDWIFTLHDQLTCEDGQKITAEAFKHSLERSLKTFDADELAQTPFHQLKSMHAQGSDLVLAFAQPMGKSVLEYLAMTPFSFLCEANFENGKWKSREHFVSSGPYRVTRFDSRDGCVLALRPEWPLNPEGAAREIRLGQKTDSSNPTTAELELTYAQPKNSRSTDHFIFEVPRALISVRLGIDKNHFFHERSRRLALKAALDAAADETTIPFENYHRAHSFFFGQVTGHESPAMNSVPVVAPEKPLRIRVFSGNTTSEEFFIQPLKSALEKLGWPYEIMQSGVGSIQDFHKQDYDISFDRSHVDATLDPDLVRILFKSKLGPRYQDPGDRISHLVDQFDDGDLSYRDFLVSFNAILAEEAAVIPLFHRGFTFRFSPNVDIKDVSPLMSIVRFEELKINPHD